MKDACIIELQFAVPKNFIFRMCQRVENENDTELCKTLHNACHEFYANYERLLSLVMIWDWNSITGNVVMQDGL